jgi:uncharacterized ion transporter superfamily protein YfcC
MATDTKTMAADSGKKEGKILNPFLVLFSVIIFCAVLSYFVTPGAYDRTDLNGRMIVVADSYHSVERTPVSFLDVFLSIPNGLQGAAGMMFLVLIIGGVVEVYNRTGAIDQAMLKISSISEKVGSQAVLVCIMLLFAFLGGILGWSEQVIPFVPIIISLCLALGYDALVGMAVSGFMCLMCFAVAPFNIYTVGLSHQIAELPMFSGSALRLTALATYTVLCMLYILRYARKVKANPELSLVKDIDDSGLRRDFSEIKSTVMTRMQALSLVIFGMSFFVAVYGLLQNGWGLHHMSAIFLIGGLAVGILNRMNNHAITDALIAGARAAFPGALIIGVARAIQWVLTTGGMVDPIIHALADMLQSVSPFLTTVGIYITNMFINAFIPSGSGQAMTVMPVLVPLADMLHITRQTIILAYQFGDGISNSLWFTNGTLLIYLGLARVPLRKWYRFIIPFHAVSFLVACSFLYFACESGYGPF